MPLNIMCAYYFSEFYRLLLDCQEDKGLHFEVPASLLFNESLEVWLELLV